MFVFLTAAPRSFFLSVCLRDFKFHSRGCIIRSCALSALVSHQNDLLRSIFAGFSSLMGTETLANRHFSTARSPFVQIQSETKTKIKKVFRLSLLSPRARHTRKAFLYAAGRYSFSHFRGLLAIRASGEMTFDIKTKSIAQKFIIRHLHFILRTVQGETKPEQSANNHFPSEK